MKQELRKQVPLSCKLISIYFYVLSVFVLIEGIREAKYYFYSNLKLVAFLSLIIMLVILCFFIGRGLLKLQNWSRIAGIIMLAFTITFGIPLTLEAIRQGDFFDFFILTINIVVLYYLMFNSKLRSAFTLTESKIFLIVISIAVSLFVISSAIYSIFNISGMSCNKITDQFKRDQCYLKISLQAQNPTVCDKIEDKLTQGGCHLNFVLRNLDSSACSKLQDESHKYICYSQIARDLKDSNLCSEIEKEYFRDLCYLDVAVAKEDVSICKKVSDNDTEERCAIEVAGESGEPSICEHLEEGINRDNCYAGVARRRHDGSFCKVISDQERKNVCYKSLN
ncbi:MAG: hypothetical protein AABX33_01785 [Nanoarchaeota archaeon]